jgi:probable rRNA maturation factor
VLSFPIDRLEGLDSGGAGGDVGSHPHAAAEPVTRELGDVVICPQHTADLREAIVHGMLHLLGMDHETDGGEMLALQDRLLRREGR